ncbi:MAG: CAAX protease, partial [Chloroflexota bacterium]
FIVLLIAAWLSPLESISWYAGWADGLEISVPMPAPADDIQADHVVVYLTGISDIEGESLDEHEVQFLARLREEIAKADASILIIEDIFPYSVSNTALTGQRVFAGFWGWVKSLRGTKNPIVFMVNIRNLFQVAVSADSRYGPIYNKSMADYITNNLKQRGYVIGSDIPLTLIGYSGGGQISMGAAPFLRHQLKTSVAVISVGGVMCSPKGLKNIASVHHLYGSRDLVQLIGVVIFPARWRVRYFSAWNKGRRSGKITSTGLPGMVHTGSHAYFDASAFNKDGVSFQEQTLAIILKLLLKRSEETVTQPA